MTLSKNRTLALRLTARYSSSRGFFRCWLMKKTVIFTFCSCACKPSHRVCPGTSTVEWFHEGLINNSLTAASNPLNSSQWLQRARLKHIDNLVHAQVEGVHSHNLLLGNTGTLLEIPVDDNRIAAAVGHEISHCIMRHISEGRGDSLISELCRCRARSVRHNTRSRSIRPADTLVFAH